MPRRTLRPTPFPTRRSSDLSKIPAVVRHPRGGLVRDLLRPHVVAPAQLEPVDPHPARRLVDQALRSEEHTSELQSPDHLVCRLLLEKKKPSEITDPNSKRLK